MIGVTEMIDIRDYGLKPCPFCGEMPGTEVEVTQMGGGKDHVDFKVVCGECGTEKVVRLTIRGKCNFALVEQAMTHAVSAWNCRVVKGKEGDDGTAEKTEKTV